MPIKISKKILAGYSIAGLLTTMLYTAGCSDRKELQEELEDPQKPQQPLIMEDEPTKAGKPSGKETKIRGTSG